LTFDREAILDRLLAVALVAVESPPIVAAWGDHLLGHRALAAPGSEGHEAPLELKPRQPLREHRELGGLFLRRLVP
jgi:hypothetical protein